MKVYDYQTGNTLSGKPTQGMIRESERESSGTGAVGAILRRGWWYYVPQSRQSALSSSECGSLRTVYVQ
jgi:hypothetical protein